MNISKSPVTASPYLAVFTSPLGRPRGFSAPLNHMIAMLALLLAPGFFLSCSDSFSAVGAGERSPDSAGNDAPLLLELALGARAAALADGTLMDLYVFNDDGAMRLDTYQRCSVKDGKVKVATTGGRKILAAVANPTGDKYQWSGDNSLAALRRRTVFFNRDSPDAPLMSGISHFSADGPCSIDLEPLMSKVVLRSIRCDFRGKPYASEQLEDGKVYLGNISSEYPAFPEGLPPTVETIHFGEKQPLPARVGVDFTETDIPLYCYPNTNEQESPGSPFTTLVVEGSVGGRIWYWPIRVNREDICWVEGNPGIERNRVYNFDITLKHLGNDSPDKPVSVQAVDIRCSVVPWTSRPETVEYF